MITGSFSFFPFKAVFPIHWYSFETSVFMVWRAHGGQGWQRGELGSLPLGQTLALKLRLDAGYGSHLLPQCSPNLM